LRRKCPAPFPCPAPFSCPAPLVPCVVIVVISWPSVPCAFVPCSP